MKNNDNFFLDILEKFRDGEMKSGLCAAVDPSPACSLIPHDPESFEDVYSIFSHFEPVLQDRQDLFNELKSITYWGSEHINQQFGKLTPLRETILLFCAAINGEY